MNLCEIPVGLLGLETFEGLRDKPDASVIDGEEFMSLPVLLGADTNYADDEAGFKALMDDWVAQLLDNGVPLSHIRESIDIDEALSHERAHRDAALIGGFSVVKYAVFTSLREDAIKLPFFKTVINRAYNIRPAIIPLFPERDITKLAMASIIAAPEYLSDGDMAQLESMGYEGAGDVAERVIRHNQTSDTTPLMVPLSTQ